MLDVWGEKSSEVLSREYKWKYQENIARVPSSIIGMLMVHRHEFNKRVKGVKDYTREWL